jgi:hypothetical protein
MMTHPGFKKLAVTLVLSSLVIFSIKVSCGFKSDVPRNGHKISDQSSNAGMQPILLKSVERSVQA